jgi:hypothetical protein
MYLYTILLNRVGIMHINKCMYTIVMWKIKENAIM